MLFFNSFKLKLIHLGIPYFIYSHNFHNYTKKLCQFVPYKKHSISHRKLSLFTKLQCEDSKVLSKDDEALLCDPNFFPITDRLHRHPGTSHNILLIQPRIKMPGPKFETHEATEHKVAEAIALVHTLPGWRVVQQHVISITSDTSKFIFGTGNLENLKQILLRNINITAIFIGIDIMTALQNSNLEGYFKVPVFDRYQIILQIFHDHAHTREAKLQLALAEIPYLRVKLAGYSHTRDATYFTGIHHVGGDNETYLEKRRRLLKEREIKLKRALEKVKNQRELLRRSERRIALPVIAVVGYTNCGKTTLIKSLTNDTRLHPEDKLFATLDVTLHSGLLPSNQKVLFIDTVGFISDVPTALLQSFRSTLEEVTLADLVIHIRDISHPDTEQQKVTVLKTLEELDLPQKLIDSILEVRNKVDLLDSIPEGDNSEVSYISATKGTGLPELLETVEERLFENTGHSAILLKIPNGGKEYSWLMREGAIRDAIVDSQDSGCLIVEVVLSSVTLAKFKHRFGDLTVSLDEIIKES